MEVQEEIAAGVPDARLCVIEECGHLSPLERPHAVTALMRDWLSRPQLSVCGATAGRAGTAR